MQRKNDYSDLLSFVKTIDDVNLLLADIGVLEKNLFKTTAATAETTPLPKNILDFFARLFSEDKRDRIEILTGVKKDLTDLPLLKMTLAIKPDSATIDVLSAWARKNITADVILDLSYDPAIIAGAQISWKGKYGDFSLRKKIEGYKDYNNL
jgi:hypothetical protein